jgi:hypothetical protein
VKYKVSWDNGASACGTFPQVFDTEEDAQAFADEWVMEMDSTAMAEGMSEEDIEDGLGYSAEVIEVEDEPKPDEDATEEEK